MDDDVHEHRKIETPSLCIFTTRRGVQAWDGWNQV